MSAIVFEVCMLIALAVHASYGCRSFYQISGTPTKRPIKFVYKKGDHMNARVNFENLSPSEVVYRVHQYEIPFTSSHMLKTMSILNNNGGAYFYSINQRLVNKEIYITIFLATNRGLCENIPIFEGSAVDRNLSASEYYNNSKCLRSSPCEITMDLKNVCIDDASFSTTEKPLINKEPPMMTTTVIPVTDVPNHNNDTSMSNVSISPHASSETTTIVMISNNTSKPQPALLAPFKFNYRGEHNFLNIVVNLKTWSKSVISSEIYETGANKTNAQTANHVKCQNDSKEHLCTIINLKINSTFEFVSIYLAVKTAQGCSKNITILHGTKLHSQTNQEVRSDCLKTCACTIEVDLKDACPDFVSETSQTEATSTTANATNTRTLNNNALIIIISSVSGIALTPLVIIAIWKRCWIKRRPQSATEPTNTNAEPFYVNLLFRRECAEEIAAIEQHHYEEINPQVPK